MAEPHFLEYAQTFLLAMLIIILVARETAADTANDIHANGPLTFVVLIVFYGILTAGIIAIGCGIYFGGGWLIRSYSSGA